MPFIGNQPAEAFSSFQKQDFTTSATTSYTLDHSVANGNEIALFINFVRQEPTTAYTASGTSLTLTSATSSSDDMYCVFLGKAVQTVNPPNSSVGNSQLDVSAINSQTAETSIAGGDEVLIYDTSASALRKMTRTNFVSGVGGNNTPAFLATSTSNQAISSGATTQITFNNEVFDTDNAFASNQFTVPTGEDGKYFFHFQLPYINPNETGYRVLYLVKGTANMIEVQFNGVDIDRQTISGSGILDLSGGDVISVDFYQSSGSSINTMAISGDGVQFGGFKLIGV